MIRQQVQVKPLFIALWMQELCCEHEAVRSLKLQRM